MSTATEAESAMFQRFDCVPLASGDKRENRQRRKRRAEVSRTTSAFLVAMASDNPPKTEAEAMRFVLPAASVLLSFLFQTFGAQIVSALWSWWHGRNSSAAL